MKRHTRPYGCTFQRCRKRFGSRNDWKRHENSQHFIQEIWVCTLPKGEDEECRRVLPNKPRLQKHLRVDHALSTDEANEERCDSMRLGRDGHHRFWCGFCERAIEQQRENQGAWDVRFKHIGDHFDKDDCHIDNWLCLDENKKKGLITPEDRKNAKRRMRMPVLMDDDESELDDFDPLEGQTVPDTRKTAPVYAQPSHDTGMLGQNNTCLPGQQGLSDVDADGEIDEDWRRNGRWSLTT